jgi:hypothetical protein
MAIEASLRDIEPVKEEENVATVEDADDGDESDTDTDISDLPTETQLSKEGAVEIKTSFSVPRPPPTPVPKNLIFPAASISLEHEQALDMIVAGCIKKFGTKSSERKSTERKSTERREKSVKEDFSGKNRIPDLENRIPDPEIYLC